MSKSSSRMLALTALCAIVPALALAMGSHPKNVDEEAVNSRILPLAKVKLAPLAATGTAAGSRTGEELYQARLRCLS